MTARFLFCNTLESGGQHDRDKVEIVRGEVPEPHAYKVCLGTSSRATLTGRAALLTKEGVALLRQASAFRKTIILQLSHHPKLLEFVSRSYP